jgi:UDP-N-acetylmuramyl pentapeptide synthase
MSMQAISAEKQEGDFILIKSSEFGEMSSESKNRREKLMTPN